MYFRFPKPEPWIYAALAHFFLNRVSSRRKGGKALCLKGSLSLTKEINAPCKAVLIRLNYHTYNYATVLELVVDEEPGVLQKESQFPGPIIHVTPCDATAANLPNVFLF